MLMLSSNFYIIFFIFVMFFSITALQLSYVAMTSVFDSHI